MTVNEIIRAFEHCSKYTCEGCPYFDDLGCAEYLMRDAVDLIKNQKAEIELLNAKNKDLAEQFFYLDIECDRLEKANETVQIETVQAFIRRLKSKEFETPVDAYSVGYLLGADEIDDITYEVLYKQRMEDE